MLAHLKAWWAAHLTLVGAAVTFLSPSVDKFLSSHAQVASILGAVWAYVLLYLKSPKQGGTSGS